MSGMTRAQRMSRTAAAGPGLVVLVAALLAGLLGMHGLGPSPTVAAPHRAPAAASASISGCGPAHGRERPGADPSHSTAHRASDRYAGDDGVGDGAGGHVAHAGGVCVAGGVSTAPELPALAPSVTACAADGAAAGAGRRAGSTAGERAPPSLAELQLLRI
jgi:hypothetical protein